MGAGEDSGLGAGRALGLQLRPDARPGMGLGRRTGLRMGSRQGSRTGNADLRNTGEGGWCYTEHELFRVFLPLIGADGGMVYMAMTRLVPLAAVREELPVTVEAVSRESCVSRSTAHRKMRELVQLGMVLETRSSSRRPSAYQLPPLRELARVGEPELRRRLDALHGEKGAKATTVAGTVRMDSSPASGALDLLEGGSEADWAAAPL